MERMWWTHITKANKFINDIVAIAGGGKSLVLSLPKSIPWRDTMMELIKEKLRMGNSQRIFDLISCPKEHIGLFLLNNYCKASKRNMYRPRMSYAVFLGDADDIVLNDRYIWISDIPANRFNEIQEFVSEYSQQVKDRAPAIFILEVSDESVTYKFKKGIGKLSFEQNITLYDKYTFCSLVVTENTCKDYMKAYLAELVASICNEDIELCAECISMGTKFLKNPIESIRSVIETTSRSDGTRYDFSKDEEQINTIIWETQLKHIFPRTEKYRSDFVGKHAEVINGALPIKSTYGETINNPQDVELGTLVYLVGDRRLTISQKEYEQLKMYRSVRNSLAHLKVIEYALVEKVLSDKN